MILEKNMISSEEIKDMFELKQRVNYDFVLQEMVKIWQNKKIKPRILMHSCCAPCSTYTLEYLTQYAEVTIYYENPNIYPRLEYERRKNVQQRFIENFNNKTCNRVAFASAKYNPNEWLNAVKGLQDEPEGGARCKACYSYRLDRVAKKAQEWEFDYFGSALTISPHKDAQIINELGLEIQYMYKVSYLPSDFKKRSGYQRSVEMSKEYNVYRQCYCGCIFGAKKQGVDLSAVNKEAYVYIKKHKSDNFNNIAFHYFKK